MSKYTSKYLEEKLQKELNASFVKAIDESDGCGGKFNVTIVSEQFKGKSLLQKHRLVNSVLAEELKEIHALSLKLFSSTEEWNTKQQQQQQQQEEEEKEKKQ